MVLDFDNEIEILLHDQEKIVFLLHCLSNLNYFFRFLTKNLVTDLILRLVSRKSKINRFFLSK